MTARSLARPAPNPGLYAAAFEYDIVRPWLAAFDRISRLLDLLGGQILAMAGFLPDEGESMNVDQVIKNITTDRGTDLELLLFTNVAPGETITEATLTEPTGTGYARKTLTDGTWTGSGDTRSYAQQTFTAGSGGWTGSVQGYAIVSKGTTPRIVAIEVDSSGPYTFAENDTYDITPNITYS